MNSSIYIIRRNFILIQTFGLLVFFLFSKLFDLYGSAVFLRILSIWCIVSYFYFFVKEVKYSLDFHPFMILELFTIQFVGLNGWSIANHLDKGENVYFGVFVINSYINEGYLFLLLEHLLLFISFFVIERLNNKNHKYSRTIYSSVKAFKGNYVARAIQLYLVVLLFRFVNLIFPLAKISSILNSFANMGQLLPLTFLVFAMLKNKQDKTAVNLHWIIVVIEILIVINLGMKEFILINLIPYCIYLFLAYKSKIESFNFSFLLRIIFIYVFTIYIVFPYISIFRSMAIEEDIDWTELSTKRVVDEFITYIQDPEQYDLDSSEGRSIDYAMSRAGSVGCNAWAIHYAEVYGATPELFYYALSNMIPRFLWPSKPNNSLGGKVSSLAHGNSFEEEDERGSVTLGFIGGCYFSLGIWGGILIPFFMGFLMARIWYWTKQRLFCSIISLWVFFSLVLILIKDMEGLQDCGVTFTIFSIIYIIVIRLTQKTTKIVR